MTLLNNGQPIGGIIQVAYTVADIEAAVRSYAEDLRIGPWFLRGPLQAPEADLSRSSAEPHARSRSLIPGT
jgi:hypothetical protein